MHYIIGAMDAAIVKQLILLNQQFYQTFAKQFSATRQQIQPGVRKAIQSIPPDSRILDLGCGNGVLWQQLVEAGYRGAYLGLDFSSELLKTAAGSASLLQAHNPRTPQVDFIQVDLAKKGWKARIPHPPYDFALAFAVLHHLPGEQTVIQVLEQTRQLLAPGGELIFSVWQFLNSPRLRQRLQDWSEVGISSDQVEPGDYLMDWRQGGRGLRYVHYFSPEGLRQLASRCGFSCREEYLSDGKGGNLSLYQVWRLENVIV
jgi:tRNA (uracil-5-)-methyltransferase TRM9